MPMNTAPRTGPYSFAGNTALASHWVKRRLESFGLVLLAPVQTVKIGGRTWFEAKTSDGPRWARINGKHIEVTKERPND